MAWDTQTMNFSSNNRLHRLCDFTLLFRKEKTEAVRKKSIVFSYSDYL